MPLFAEPGSPTLAALRPSSNRAPSDDADWPALWIFGRRPYPPATADRWPLRRTDPRQAGDYRLMSRLGSGGTADVFYATGPTGLSVAVKIFRDKDRSVDVYRREFRLANAVDPESTAPILGYGVSAAGAYLVTAYLPGYRSGKTLLETPVPVGRLWRLGSALARTLAAIHARGVIHCDVKPSNLLIRRNDMRLIDFGIARYTGEPGRTDGIVECSRGWAAPEQLTTAPITPAVDVFAWGCLIAYLAGGVHPFASNSTQEWMLRIRSAEPDLYGLPDDLAEVVAATLARDQQTRPSATDLAAICRAHRPRPAGQMLAQPSPPTPRRHALAAQAGG
jgi:serine/threonine protein kinase